MPDLPQLLATLNDEQQAAVLHERGPAIVLAGAGSGKTRVLTTRASYLLAQGQVANHEILLVTFTNKAAAEMQQRILQQSALSLPFSGTFHSLSARILRQVARTGALSKYQLTENFSIYDTDDQISVIKNIYKQYNFDTALCKPQSAKHRISSAKNSMLSPGAFSEQARDEASVLAAKVYKLYQERLRQENALDFDDLLNTCYQLLRDNRSLREQYQSQFKHVLIDEFQDTNQVQYLLTRIFTKPHDQLFAVGDFAQSIYAWRGADYRNLQRLQKDFQHISEYRLERNYRSTQTILDAATSVIAHNRSHPILSLWTQDKAQDKIQVHEYSSGEEEARAIATTIANLYGNQLDQVAILYRTNAQSRAFEEAFLNRRLPYQIVGGTKFYDRTEIKDVLAYLRLAINPLDSPSLQRATKLGKRRLQKFQSWLAQQTPAALQQPLECLQAILRETDYLSKYDPKDEEEAMRLDNVQELLNVASRFDSSTAFLENLALIQDGYLANDVQGLDKQRAVTLMSLHSAKGLEFDVVFMVGMEEGLLPHSRALLENNELEEERRLCYVGITRARRQLYLSYARNRFTYGYSSQCMPSRFLSEIDSKLIKLERSFNSDSGYQRQSNSWRKQAQAPTKQTPATTPKRQLVIDEDSLEALINDELDVASFLRS